MKIISTVYFYRTGYVLIKTAVVSCLLCAKDNRRYGTRPWRTYQEKLLHVEEGVGGNPASGGSVKQKVNKNYLITQVVKVASLACPLQVFRVIFFTRKVHHTRNITSALLLVVFLF